MEMFEKIARDAFEDELQKIAVSAGLISSASASRLKRVLIPSKKVNELIKNLELYSPVLRGTPAKEVKNMDLKNVSLLQKSAPKGSRISYNQLVERLKKK